jgi:hypothetical protein
MVRPGSGAVNRLRLRAVTESGKTNGRWRSLVISHSSFVLGSWSVVLGDAGLSTSIRLVRIEVAVVSQAASWLMTND